MSLTNNYKTSSIAISKVDIILSLQVEAIQRYCTVKLYNNTQFTFQSKIT